MKFFRLTKMQVNVNLKNAFYRLSKKYHPDVASSTECSNNKFVEIFNAYEILKDKQKKRSEYDQIIKTKRQNAQQLYSLSKSKRNCLKQRQQQSSTQINSSSSPINLRIFSILTTKENNPFFDNLMKEDGWKKMKIFGIGFICFLLIYFVFVRFWYLKK
ncbi:J domain-containing protein [Meloidogyne graminicola]|uniref:J domain-containing protein n=1 Tax=Meloidogyne graminicola TaxID=189291 RepID=A0A8S9ZV03_9BILA|nr:J domain-containing protein [Meloidogyne graminicola]